MQAGKPVPISSQPLTLATEFDSGTQFIRVGGCLRHTPSLDQAIINPVVPDSTMASDVSYLAGYPFELLSGQGPNFKGTLQP